ncbi:NADPH-dependent F420 reductase [Streptomyces neyagawaensis]|uniref:NADPH-dependent F420 reductase n=2 Tax=Streptomyces neyagawaensis TaxID=42238 RepID=UPI00201D2A83|nr:NAD(P)-binding domain-containing protein [Streptomyces neyagawaensis]MCL6739134.1 NAD(P)-binding domain-containing protein [Streptomyces neyagawaensis]MDE1686988.1 NAD(P)-binding domain-containing protein [Streptomyces neyagawaensis]
MATLGIIGSGKIGTAVARLAVAAGIDVVLSNSRGPETLAEAVAELGGRARAATPEEAARAGDWVLVSVPLSAYRDLPAGALAGKVMLDTSNYYPMRDGTIEVLDSGKTTTSELVQEHLVGAKLIKAFNNISDVHIASLARPLGAADRTALPIAGDDPEARASAVELISRLGFDTVDVGTLADSWRFEPETDAYGAPYFTDPDATRAAWARLAEAIRAGAPLEAPAIDDPGTPLPAARLRALLADTPRKLTADRVLA